MQNDKIYRCPKHGVLLLKKRVLYGYVTPDGDYRNVILGGCCVDDDSPKCGYECPVDSAVYFLNASDELVMRTEDD